MNKQEKGIALILYLLWPITAIVTGIKNFESSFGRNLLVAVFVFMGYTAVETGDLERYALQYYDNNNITLAEFLNSFLNLKISKFFNEISSIIFSIFDDHHIYFGFLFGVFGYYLVNTINLLRLGPLKSYKYFPVLSFIVFALFFSVASIVNYAFYAGAIFFLYYLVKIVLEQKTRKSYMLIFLTPLFHFGLLPLLFVPVFLLVFKQRTYLYISVLILFTVLSQSFFVQNIGSFTQDSDTILDTKYEAYASEDGQERMEERYGEGYQKGNFNYRILRDLREISNNVAIPLLFFLIYFNRKLLGNDRFFIDLFNVSIGSLAITHLMLNVSQGERFYYLSGFLCLGAATYLVQKVGYFKLKYRVLFYITFLFLCLNNVVSLINLKGLIGVDFVFSNFPIMLYNLL